MFTGVTLRAWKGYEQGIRESKFEYLCKIADTIGVTTDYLLGREQESKSSLDCLVAEHNMTDVEEKILQNYLDTPVETRNAIMKILYKS